MSLLPEDDDSMSIDIDLNDLNKSPEADLLEKLLCWKWTPLAGAIVGAVIGVIVALVTP